MLKILIIIPVLNEENNIYPIFFKIKKNVRIKKDILFIDDNSSDKTREKILNIKKKNKNVYLLNRVKKKGIGSAHKDGIKWGYSKKYKVIVTMDCDGTHNPVYINKMIKIINLKNYDLISTNRFLRKNSLSDWSLWRKLLTSLRHILINFLLNIKYDSSGAFRCYNINRIPLHDILKAKNNSYSFFWESMFFLSKKYRIYEIPITLPGRLTGSSKMKIKDIFEALFYLIRIYYKFKF